MRHARHFLLLPIDFYPTNMKEQVLRCGLAMLQLIAEVIVGSFLSGLVKYF